MTHTFNVVQMTECIYLNCFQDVVKYSIIKNRSGVAAKEYFFINAESGLISVGANLVNSKPKASFIVSV